MISDIFTGFTIVITFLYIFWRRLKEDYSASSIFTTSLYVLLGILVGLIVSRKFLPSWWFWLSFSGTGLGLALGIFRFHLRFFETLEACTIGFLPGLSLIFLNDSIKTSSVVSFVSFVVIAALIALFYFFDRHYKDFSWYKSGRIGFAGLSTLGIFFLVRATIAILFPFVISFVSKYEEALISGITAFIFFLLIYNLSREI